MNQLEEIKARAEKATQGPWMAFKGPNADGVDCTESGLTWDDHNGEVFKPEDADFIAHARTDVPKLLAALGAVEALAEEAMSESAYLLPGGYPSKPVEARLILTVISEALQ